MKAIRVSTFGAPDVMKLEQIDTPRPGPGQVLVRVRAAGVNPVDTYIRSGQYASKPELPYTPGYDGAGEVVEIVPRGAERPAWPVQGSRVWIGKRARDGTYAEYTICELDQIHPLPARLSFAQGAGVYVAYCTAWRALFGRAEAKPGETVLIHGASGGVGLAAAQIARAAGLRVLGTAGTPAGLDLAKQAGCHVVINHRDAGYEAQLAEAAKPAGINIILEMLANVNLQRDLDLVAPRGRVVVVGNRGSLDFNPRAAMGKDASILGMSLMNLTPQEAAETTAGVQAGLESGVLTPIVARELPLAHAPAAHELVLSSGARGKVVLVV